MPTPREHRAAYRRRHRKVWCLRCDRAGVRVHPRLRLCRHCIEDLTGAPCRLRLVGAVEYARIQERERERTRALMDQLRRWAGQNLRAA